jgi:glucose-1-phosphate thymidylyltransferase
MLALSVSQRSTTMTSTRTRPVVGIVPAAGRATRLPDREGSKELVAVGEVRDGGGLRPRAISEHLVDAMRDAGAGRICLIVAPGKHDIAQFYGDGSGHGVAIEYLCQQQPTGMSDAIDLAYASLRGATVLMGMPDTIVRPSHSLRDIRTLLDDRQCDVALAVAPTEEPWRLGPVTIDVEGRVVEVFDKPHPAPHNLVWTVAAWGPRFTEFLHDHLVAPVRTIPEAPLGLIFQAAIAQGFDVRARSFADGCYIDAGTPEGLAAARRFVSGEAVEV